MDTGRMTTEVVEREDEKVIDLIWGAESIGQVINRTARQVFYMASVGALPGVYKIGGQLCANRHVLRKTFE